MQLRSAGEVSDRAGAVFRGPLRVRGRCGAHPIFSLASSPEASLGPPASPTYRYGSFGGLERNLLEFEDDVRGLPEDHRQPALRLRRIDAPRGIDDFRLEIVVFDDHVPAAIGPVHAELRGLDGAALGP